MGRYIVIWELDLGRIPSDPKEKIEVYNKLLEMVKEDVEGGPTKDFGVFFDGSAGFSIKEGTEEEVAISVLKYIPYVKCKTYPILSIKQLDKILKAYRINISNNSD